MRGAIVAVAACGFQPPVAGDAAVELDAAAPVATFRNPLDGGPDPFLTYADGFYYLATTQGDAIRIWKAASLAELAAVPATTVWHDSDPSRNRDVWAPSLYRFDGRWYLYYTADDGTDDHHRLYAIEADDPLGPYRFAGKLEPPNATGVWAIDPVVLDGRYVIWSGAGSEGHNLLYIAPLSDPTTISGARAYLPAAGGCAEVREAPAILQRGDTTFLVYSTCDTGKPDYQLWMMTIARRDDPMIAGNWHQHPAAVFARDDAAGVWGPGSNGFFTSPDGSEDWIVFHAKNTTEYTYDGRTTRAQRIAWVDGVPRLGAPHGVDDALELPAGDPGHGTTPLDDDGAVFSPGWTASRCGVQCFLGGEHVSSDVGATATFAFIGTRIVLYAVRDPGRGIASIQIDDAPATTADLYAPIRQGHQPIYASPLLATGAHVLRVTVTGDANPAATGTAIGVDRAEVGDGFR